MTLQEICDLIAQSLLPVVDANAPGGTSNQRTNAPYLPGVPSMNENAVRDAMVVAWNANHQHLLAAGTALEKEVPYPNLPRARCDLRFSSVGWKGPLPEWAIELKRIQFVGDNGKNNDHNVQKMLSPYLKDRSLVHDVERMRQYPLAHHHAVIGYAFSYDLQTCNAARKRHASERTRIRNIETVCKTNDPTHGVLSCVDIIDAANLLLQRRGIVGQHVRAPFSDLWRHPCGGHGQVFGWQVA